MTIINLIISLIISLLAGYGFIRFLTRKMPLPGLLHISLSWGMGQGLIALWMFTLNILKIKFSLFAIEIPILIISTIFFLLSQRPNATTYRDSNKNHPGGVLIQCLNAILIIFIIHNVLITCWSAINIPIFSWDALATVAFKAKVFFYDGTINISELPHRTYPILTPLLEAWTAFNLGYWSETLVKVIFPVSLISFLAIQYYFMNRLTNRTWALISCALLLSSNLFFFHTTISYRDFLLSYYNCITIMLILLWREDNNLGLLIISSFFAGLASFTKLEGTSFMFIYLIMFSLINFFENKRQIKEKISNMLYFILPSFSIGASFHIYKILIGVTTEGSKIGARTHFDFTLGKLNVIPKIFQGFAQNIFFTANWNILWIVLVIMIALSLKCKISRETQYILLAIILFFGLYSAVSLLTSNFLWISGPRRFVTLSRLILHFFPLSVLAISLLGHQILESDDQ